MNRADRKKRMYMYIEQQQTLYERWNMKRSFQTIRIIKKEGKYQGFSCQLKKKTPKQGRHCNFQDTKRDTDRHSLSISDKRRG